MTMKGNIRWLAGMIAVFLGSVYLLFVMPDRWDGAVVVKVCHHGRLILRDKKGITWVRSNALVAYRVENPDTVCAP